jgi:hypothetical protein
VTPDLLLQLFGTACVGVGVYAGIRADIASLHVKVATALRAVERAHERIDSHFDNQPPTRRKEAL